MVTGDNIAHLLPAFWNEFSLCAKHGLNLKI